MRGGWIVALVALVACAAPPAWSQDEGGRERETEEPAGEQRPEERRYDLRAGYLAKVGDRVACETSSKSEVLVTLSRRGQPLRVENKQQGFELRYVDEITRIAPGGGVRAIRRTYSYVKDFATGRVDRERRVVDLSWDGGEFEFEKQGELHPRAEELLENEARRPQGIYDVMLPARPVPIGYRWKIPTDAAAHLFLMKPEDLAHDVSRAGGQLHSRHPRSDIDVLRIVLQFDLTLERISDFKLDFSRKPLRLRCAFSIWDAQGSPYVSTTFKGVAEGEARYEDESIPKDVSCTIRQVVTGTHKRKPAEPDDRWQ